MLGETSAHAQWDDIGAEHYELVINNATTSTTGTTTVTCPNDPTPHTAPFTCPTTTGTTGSNTQVTLVAATSTIVIAANNGRKEVLLQNLHASSDAFCGVTTPITSSIGWKLGAGVTVIRDRFTAAIYCISTGTPTIAIEEIQ